jgi:hypothetical protein
MDTFIQKEVIIDTRKEKQRITEHTKLSEGAEHPSWEQQDIA